MGRKVFTFAWVCLLYALPASAQAALSVFACEPEWKALVEEIGGSNVKAFSATTGMQDPHYIEARPSLISKARSADMLICTGAELEVGWLPVVQRRSGNPRIQDGAEGVFFAAQYVSRLEIPESVENARGDVHASGNPHVHLDPHRLLTIAVELSKRLKSLDPENADSYEQSLTAFRENWSNATSEWEARMAPLKGTRVVVHHKSWSYLFEWLDWKSVAELEPVPGSPPTTRHLATLIDVVKQENPAAIILATFQDPRGANWLSKKTDVPIATLPLTIEGSDSATNLYSLFEDIVSRLSAAVGA